MGKKRHPIRVLLDPKRYFLIIFLGLSVAVYLAYTSTNWNDLAKIELNAQFFIFFFVAFCCIVVRDLAYMIRLKLLTDNKLSWRQVFDVIMLWEFGSSVTPSAVGGTPIAILLLTKEGVNPGKSTATVLLTAFFDELFFVIMVPLCYLLMQSKTIFVTDSSLTGVVEFMFFTSYSLIVLYSLIIGYALFINPRVIYKLVNKVFSLRLLKRWQKFGQTTASQILEASENMAGKPFSFWVKVFVSTFFSWTARYAVVNFLILAFVAVSDHFLIYARQLIMWVIMLISPTPGGTGVAELTFTAYLSDFIPAEIVGVLAILWRLISYYLYLVAGVIILPRWLRRVYLKRKLIKFRTP